MLVHRLALQAAMFASSEPDRPALAHVRVDPDGTAWATDRHVAVRVKPRMPDEGEYPAVSGLPDGAKSPTAPVLVPADVARAVVKALPKRVPLSLLRDYALLRVTDSTGYLAVTDSVTPTAKAFPLPEHQFPNVASLYANQDARLGALANPDKRREREWSDPIAFRAEYLALIARYREACGEDEAITLTRFAPLDPVSFQWRTEDVDVHVILMPMRL